jgi:hypothetical protein
MRGSLRTGWRRIFRNLFTGTDLARRHAHVHIMRIHLQRFAILEAYAKMAGTLIGVFLDLKAAQPLAGQGEIDGIVGQ